jgi:Ca-activated chloride channel family protein
MRDCAAVISSLMSRVMTFGAVLCVLLLWAGSGTAQAQEPSQDVELAPTMVVLDASGSMTGADPAGGSKMDAAKAAVHAFLDAAPDGAPVGLTAYGTATGNSDAERAQGCQDVSVLKPVGPLDRAGLGTAVDGLVPRGYTPIGRSLQVAAEQLPQEGPRSIVLVSDGVDTCAPPEPCDVVRTLAGQGVDLVVHAVGFGVDAEARAQLSCIAQATGGTYTDAPDADALERVLPRVTASALRNYQPAGTPIAGAATVEAAPVAAPGQHLDTIGQHEQRFYAVDVPEGATAYFSATVSFPRLSGVSIYEDFNSLQLRTFGDAGEDCHEFKSQQATDSSSGEALTVATTWTGATEPDNGNASGDRCRGGGRYTFALTWERVSADVPERLPVELLVGVEPPVTDAGPVAVLPTPTFVEPQGPPTPVVGGGSFNVAGTLDGSGSYTDTLQRGEFVFYRVQLDWGQGLAYRVRFKETPGRGLDNLSQFTSTTLYAPSREEIATASLSYTGSELVLPVVGPALTAAPVRYNNRTADDIEVRTQSVAGPYYIAVKVGPSFEDNETAVPVPIQIDLTVAGNPEPGPRYADVGPGAPFGERAPAEAAAGPVPAARTEIAPAGWVAIGAGAVVVIGLVVALVVRIRRRQA